MTVRCNFVKRVATCLLLLGSLLLSYGCATTAKHSAELPPILTQEELQRPYQKLGAIEVHRERYGSQADLSPEDLAWGYQALRVEAGKMGADAVIFPEVKSEREVHIIFPSSDMTAKGIAIKFR
jgi:hypothetical protein